MTSFEAMNKLRNTLIRTIEPDGPLVPIILVGNKCDLEEDRVVQTEEGKRQATRWNIEFMESSARDNINVNEVFFKMVRLIDKWRDLHCEKPVVHHKKRHCVLM